MTQETHWPRQLELSADAEAFVAGISQGEGGLSASHWSGSMPAIKASFLHVAEEGRC